MKFCFRCGSELKDFSKHGRLCPKCSTKYEEISLDNDKIVLVKDFNEGDIYY